MPRTASKSPPRRRRAWRRQKTTTPVMLSKETNPCSANRGFRRQIPQLNDSQCRLNKTDPGTCKQESTCISMPLDVPHQIQSSDMRTKALIKQTDDRNKSYPKDFSNDHKVNSVKFNVGLKSPCLRLKSLPVLLGSSLKLVTTASNSEDCVMTDNECEQSANLNVTSTENKINSRNVKVDTNNHKLVRKRVMRLENIYGEPISPQAARRIMQKQKQSAQLTHSSCITEENGRKVMIVQSSSDENVGTVDPYASTEYESQSSNTPVKPRLPDVLKFETHDSSQNGAEFINIDHEISFKKENDTSLNEQQAIDFDELSASLSGIIQKNYETIKSLLSETLHCDCHAKNKDSSYVVRSESIENEGHEIWNLFCKHNIYDKCDDRETVDIHATMDKTTNSNSTLKENSKSRLIPNDVSGERDLIDTSENVSNIRVCEHSKEIVPDQPSVIGDSEPVSVINTSLPELSSNDVNNHLAHCLSESMASCEKIQDTPDTSRSPFRLGSEINVNTILPKLQDPPLNSGQNNLPLFERIDEKGVSYADTCSKSSSVALIEKSVNKPHHDPLFCHILNGSVLSDFNESAVRCNGTMSSDPNTNLMSHKSTSLVKFHSTPVNDVSPPLVTFSSQETIECVSADENDNLDTSSLAQSEESCLRISNVWSIADDSLQTEENAQDSDVNRFDQQILYMRPEVEECGNNPAVVVEFLTSQDSLSVLGDLSSQFENSHDSTLNKIHYSKQDTVSEPANEKHAAPESSSKQQADTEEPGVLNTGVANIALKMDSIAGSDRFADNCQEDSNQEGPVLNVLEKPNLNSQMPEITSQIITIEFETCSNAINNVNSKSPDYENDSAYLERGWKREQLVEVQDDKNLQDFPMTYMASNKPNSRTKISFFPYITSLPEQYVNTCILCTDLQSTKLMQKQVYSQCGVNLSCSVQLEDISAKTIFRKNNMKFVKKGFGKKAWWKAKVKKKKWLSDSGQCKDADLLGSDVIEKHTSATQKMSVETDQLGSDRHTSATQKTSVETDQLGSDRHTSATQKTSVETERKHKHLNRHRKHKLDSPVKDVCKTAFEKMLIARRHTLNILRKKHKIKRHTTLKSLSKPLSPAQLSIRKKQALFKLPQSLSDIPKFQGPVKSKIARRILREADAKRHTNSDVTTSPPDTSLPFLEALISPRSLPSEKQLEADETLRNILGKSDNHKLLSMSFKKTGAGGSGKTDKHNPAGTVIANLPFESHVSSKSVSESSDRTILPNVQVHVDVDENLINPLKTNLNIKNQESSERLKNRFGPDEPLMFDEIKSNFSVHEEEMRFSSASFTKPYFYPDFKKLASGKTKQTDQIQNYSMNSSTSNSLILQSTSLPLIERSQSFHSFSYCKPRTTRLEFSPLSDRSLPALGARSDNYKLQLLSDLSDSLNEDGLASPSEADDDDDDSNLSFSVSTFAEHYWNQNIQFDSDNVSSKKIIFGKLSEPDSSHVKDASAIQQTFSHSTNAISPKFTFGQIKPQDLPVSHLACAPVKPYSLESTSIIERQSPDVPDVNIGERVMSKKDRSFEINPESCIVTVMSPVKTVITDVPPLPFTKPSENSFYAISTSGIHSLSYQSHDKSHDMSRTIPVQKNLDGLDLTNDRFHSLVTAKAATNKPQNNVSIEDINAVQISQSQFPEDNTLRLVDPISRLNTSIFTSPPTYMKSSPSLHLSSVSNQHKTSEHAYAGDSDNHTLAKKRKISPIRVPCSKALAHEEQEPGTQSSGVSIIFEDANKHNTERGVVKETPNAAKRVISSPKRIMVMNTHGTNKPTKKTRFHMEEMVDEDDEFDVISVLAPSEASFLYESLDDVTPVINFSSNLASCPEYDEDDDALVSPILDEAVTIPETAHMNKTKRIGNASTETYTQQSHDSQTRRNSEPAPQVLAAQDQDVCPMEFFSLHRSVPPGFCFGYVQRGQCLTKICSYRHATIPKKLGFSHGVERLRSYINVNDCRRAYETYQCLGMLKIGLPPENLIEKLLGMCCQQGMVQQVFSLMEVICQQQILSPSICNSVIRMCNSNSHLYSEQLWVLFETLQMLNIQPANDALSVLLRTFDRCEKWKHLWSLMQYCLECTGFVTPLDVQNRALNVAVQFPEQYLEHARNWIQRVDVEQLVKLDKQTLLKLVDILASHSFVSESECLKELVNSIQDPVQNMVPCPPFEPINEAMSEYDDETEHARYSPPDNMEKEEQIKTLLNRIQGCHFTQRWDYLGEIFVEQCCEELAASPRLILAYAAAMEDFNQPDVMVNAFGEFLRYTYQYFKEAHLKDSLAQLDKRMLAQISYCLLIKSYDRGMVQHAYQILSNLHTAKINYLRYESLEKRDIKRLAVEICLGVGQAQSALQILQDCKFSVISLDGCLSTDEMESRVDLTDKLLRELISRKLLRGAVLIYGFITQPSCIEKYQDLLDLRQLTYNLIVESLHVGEVHMTLSIYSRKNIVFGDKEFSPLLHRALLVACLETGLISNAEELFRYYKSLQIYHLNAMTDIGDVITLRSDFTHTEVKLLITDALQNLYQNLCGLRLENKLLLEEYFSIKIQILFHHDSNVFSTPYLTCAPRSLYSARSMVVAILHDDLEPSLQSRIVSGGLITILPVSLEVHLKTMDATGRQQGIFIDRGHMRNSQRNGNPACSFGNENMSGRNGNNRGHGAISFGARGRGAPRLFNRGRRPVRGKSNQQIW